MEIKTYELIIDTETKQSSLRIKEAFGYADDYYASPLAVFTLMIEKFRLHQMADEYVYMLAFNTKMKLLGIFEISHGTGNSSLLDARGLYIRALHIGADSIMLVHNHPSGQASSSKQDIQISKRIKDVGEFIGIPLLDHIIIGCDEYVSLNEQNII